VRRPVPGPARMSRRPDVRPRPARWALFTAGATAAVAAGIALWAVLPRPLAFTVGGPARSATAAGATAVAGKVGDVVAGRAGDDPVPLRFSDGSSILVAREAAVRIVATDARGATARLERGNADVSVRHADRTRWRFDAGPFRVLVTGTRFSLGWQPTRAAFEVRMREGSVEVEGPGLPGRVVVRGGESLLADASAATWRIGPVGLETALDRPAEAPQASAEPASARRPEQEREVTPAPGPQPPRPAEANGLARAEGGTDAGRTTAPAPRARLALRSRTGAGAAAPGPTWRLLAVAGRYRDAVTAAESTGFETWCEQLDADDLLLLADAARLARDVRRAEQAYRAARRRFPGADRPGFALGLVAFELRGDFAEAASRFDRYLAEHPRGALADEAAGRLLESWHRLGRRTEARRAAAAYLARGTAGPYTAIARELAAQ